MTQQLARQHLVVALRKRHSGDSRNRCKIQEMLEQSEKSDDQPELDELISLIQAADISGLSHSHLRLLVRRGDIWGKRMGRDWFTSTRAVQEYLTRDRRPGPKPR